MWLRMYFENEKREISNGEKMAIILDLTNNLLMRYI
jgi:hypothetical protein